MYAAEINRNSPALILFLIDCSYSMSEKYGDTKETKGEYLARITNESIDAVILSCEKGEELRAYFEIGIIGYGEKSREIIPIKTVIDLANNPLELKKTKLDGMDIEQPIWIKDPTTESNTNMKEGFELAKTVLNAWIVNHKDSFPPVLIHVSDGEWTSGSPVSAAQDIQENVFTDDGPCIIMNIHISNDEGEPSVFPDTEPDTNKHTQGLFAMSTVLPDSFLNRAKEKYPSVVAGARGYMFNANPEDLSKFFDIGTRLRG